MPELPVLSENPAIDRSTETEATPPTPEAKIQAASETSAPSVIDKKEPLEIAIPPVLQPGQVQTQTTEVAKPITDEHLNKGPTESPLTREALKDFQTLQKRLAVHYKKLESGGSA